MGMLYAAAGGIGIGIIGINIGMPAWYIFTFCFIWGIITGIINVEREYDNDV